MISSIKNKLILTLLLLCTGIIVSTGTISIIVLDNFYENQIIDDLKIKTNEIKYFIGIPKGNNEDAYEQLQKLTKEGKYRLTLIDSVGNVIFDSDIQENELGKLDNHLLRSEIVQALESGVGVSKRFSNTIKNEMQYLALRIEPRLPLNSIFSKAYFIRISIPLNKIKFATNEVKSTIIILCSLAFLIIAVVTFIISGKITHPLKSMADIATEIKKGSLDKRISYNSKDELGELATSINSMVDTMNEDIVQLKKLEKMRREFLGNVSHELRTPIFAIQGLLETLLNGALEDSDVRKDFVARALSNTKRLDTLLGELITISSIETGEMKMSFRYFKLQEFLSQSIFEMEQLAESFNVKLKLEKIDNNIEVYGDKEKLKQVVINLIQNGIKYNIPKGTVVISTMKEADQIKIIIKDSGVGISEEHISRIFERFYRIDKERSRDTGGTGLGLAIAKHIVEAHGNKLEVLSELQKGSKFSFTLQRSKI